MCDVCVCVCVCVCVQVPNPDKVLAAAAGIAQRDEGGENGAVSAEAAAASKALLAEVRAQAGHVHMRTLLLTLIEIASAMSHLHRMGEWDSVHLMSARTLHW